jgi:hypothetical protein
VVVWYLVLFPLFADSILAHSKLGLRFSLMGLALSAILCGVAAVTVAEKLRLIPSQEQAERKLRPVSIFSDDPKNSEALEKQKPDL